MSKEHAHIYEAGYRDGSTNYELEHCPACKNVADLQDVLAENTKLRELVKVIFGTGFGAGAAAALILLAIILKLKGWI